MKCFIQCYMKRVYINFIVIVFIILLPHNLLASNSLKEKDYFHGLSFESLPMVWDEGIPLGNGIMGTLIWQKESALRLSLDRADLWDLRPVEEFSSSQYSYDFICDEVIKKKDISRVHELIDARTREDVAPTKLPAGALEFPLLGFGEVESVELDVHTAVCTISWKNGTEAYFFTNAVDKIGYFKFINLPHKFFVEFKAPRFVEDKNNVETIKDNNGQNLLTRLGYKKGKLSVSDNTITYNQKVYGDVSYSVAVNWQYRSDVVEGCYALTTSGTWYSESCKADEFLKQNSKSFDVALAEHLQWWNNYWSECEIILPDDKILERQWYLEMYKFGSASRKNAPPICLQAVWTADNGQTPPWRGDFHNDLNTQLSYWPGYASNHMEESEVFTDWLWKIKNNGKAFTKKFFGVDGLNIPCIATLEGRAIGGWNQYSHQPTASGWLAHHFYLQWKYSADNTFLKERAYPWIKDVALFYEKISVKDEKGFRKLPLSSSPEINDNRLEAWFQQTTNYDLAAIRFVYTAAVEMAEFLGLADEAKHWSEMLEEWPDFAKDDNGLLIAPDFAFKESHRHFSHMLAFHPLGLIDLSQGKEAERLIKRSIYNVEEQGTRAWCGYTYSWLANMKARVFDGDGASKALHIFIKAFCSPNSFHLNGDQTGKGYSGFSYRPFTLEGNFACASAIQEMLLQSHTGIIRVFPALPENWRNVSFRKIRAMGGFLVSADYSEGKVTRVEVYSEKGGQLCIINPFTGKEDRRTMSSGETYVIDCPNILK